MEARQAHAECVIQSFNGKFRDECLNPELVVDLRHAREVIESWRVDYNTVRPHSFLRYLTAEEFAASVAAQPASPPTPVSLSPQHGPNRRAGTRSANLMTGPKTGGGHLRVHCSLAACSLFLFPFVKTFISLCFSS